MHQTTNSLFIGICVLLFLTFSIAGYIQWREDTIRKAKQASLDRHFQDYYKKMDKK